MAETLLSRCDLSVTGVPNGFRPGERLSDGERARVTAIRDHARNLFKRLADAAFVARVFASLANERGLRPGAREELLAADYATVLTTYPEAIVGEALRRVKAGEAPDVSPRFMPTSAEMGKVCSKAMADLRKVEHSADRFLRFDRLAKPAPSGVTRWGEAWTEQEAERRRVLAEKARSVAANLGERARAKPPARTPEQREAALRADLEAMERDGLHVSDALKTKLAEQEASR